MRPISQPGHRSKWVIWVGLILMAGTLLLALLLARLRLQELVGKPLPDLGAVAPFTLTNQIGQAVSLNDLKGHVWVADIIFTRCAGPCLNMSRQMAELQRSLYKSEARLVSLTTDPEYDTPAVLRAYAKERARADTRTWWFLTGTKAQIAQLATDSLKLVAIEKDPNKRETPADLFIHSTVFVLVDAKGRLRGTFESTGEDVDAARVRKEILQGINRLEREPYP